MNNKYIATIGLEIHAELKTASKMFCSCKNDPDEEKPNANICPICLGQPGTLPVLNKEAVRHVLKIGQAVGGKISDFSEWDRKNYFYPDIPKGYQISQYKFPLISGGELSGVKLTRIHLEEDTAQSTHDMHDKSLLNFNRSGVPLMELVTEPVIRDARTAVEFAKELQLLLRYLSAGEANMEKGEMRVEANVSVATEADTKREKYGTKTEIKNLNSFKIVEKAVAYEIERQTAMLDKAEKVIQETRGWDDKTGETFSQRAKEESHDYRYFPEPDIPKVSLIKAAKEFKEFSPAEIKKELLELPWDKRARYKKDFAMTDKEVAVFVETPQIAEYFELVVDGSREGKSVSKLAVNYILTDYLGLLKKENKDPALSIGTIPAEGMSALMKMIDSKKISSRGAKEILAILMKEGGSPEDIAEKRGLIQKSSEGELNKIVEEIVKSNQIVVEDYKKGKTAALQFLVGQGMKATKGSANPEVLKQIILTQIK